MIYVLKNLNKYIHAFFSFLFGYLYPTNCFKTKIFYVQKKNKIVSIKSSSKNL